MAIKVHVHDNSKVPVEQHCLGAFELTREKILTLHLHDGPCFLCPQGHCHHGSIGILLSETGEMFLVFENTPLPARVTCDDKPAERERKESRP